MAIMRRDQFRDLVLADALPALEEVCTDTMEEFPMEHEVLYNIRTMTGSITQTAQTTGIPAVGTVEEGNDYPLDKMYQGYNKTYTAQKYGVIVPITEELLEDNEHEEAFDRAVALGRAMRESQRISAASIFNNAFSDSGPDGVSLCNTAHPLAYPGAGTTSNALATPADMSLASIEDLVTVMRKTKDQAGKKVLVRPRYVIVPPELEFLATELLDSQSKPQASTASNLTEVNAVNAVKSRYGLEVMVMDYLTDADAFFLASDKSGHKVKWYWRKQPETSSDMEFKSDVALMKIKARWALGYSDFRGIAGTPGA